jgi:flagella basal body P-ring formation protein FlgA
MKIVPAVVAFISLLFTAALCCGQQVATIEEKLAELLKTDHGARDIQVKLDSVPSHLRQKIRLRSVNIQKMPEIEGRGLALVECEGEDGRPRISYVPFHMYEKKTLFYIKRALTKGTAVSANDVGSKETYTSENALIYPDDLRDVVGKVARKDIAPGAVLTTLILESPQVIRRGETVTIVGENNSLIVKTKAKAEDSGRVGERIRVRNLSSDREVTGRVAEDGTVMVEF